MSFENTAIIMLDPYNDFLHADGKMHPSLLESLTETDTIANLQELIMAARMAQVPIFYSMRQPKQPSPTHQHSSDGASSRELLLADNVIQEGSWGGDIYEGLQPKPSNGDVVISRHWNHSAFSNTDLDYQLKKRNIRNVVIAGLNLETCFESTARYAHELGYHVTILVDTTAMASIGAASRDAAATLIWPNSVHEVMTVSEWAGRLFRY
ncbi:Isochorismatase hydrolase [Athelia psychrophila]|uniref:Isochorismatase hydrolase n=1 Tax=Athelia psychrophila TaxID=1759441 RepID=A0A167TTS2_9AGAM|nr:Isochorismatase hydrolase [Fibularhizoctonia sp. CBS 109695]